MLWTSGKPEDEDHSLMSALEKMDLEALVSLLSEQTDSNEDIPDASGKLQTDAGQSMDTVAAMDSEEKERNPNVQEEAATAASSSQEVFVCSFYKP